MVLPEERSRPYEALLGEVEAGPAKVSLLKEISIPAGHHVGMVQVDMLLSKFAPKAFTTVQDNESQMMIADEELNLFSRTDHSFCRRIRD